MTAAKPLPGTPEYDAMVRAVVDQAPPLTDLQRGRIQSLMWPKQLTRIPA